MIGISASPLFRHIHFPTVGCDQRVSRLVVSEYPRVSFVRANVELLGVVELAIFDTVAVVVKPVDGERSPSAANEFHQRLGITMH